MIKKIEENANLYLQIFIIFILLGAFFLEIFFQVVPCNLCLVQRIFWLLLLLGSILNFPIRNLLIIVFVNALIAGYQILLQNALLQETACKVNFNVSKNVINKSCSDIDFSVFGFSLATYNFIILFFISFYIIKFVKKAK